MAIIARNTETAEVKAIGSAMNATVNFSGALMEMLATVYAYILMSAIREAIQNACDASKRAGLSFAEGVLVQLPTPSNLMITVIDKGSGMTKAFMEDPEGGYLSYGTSTKAGDNGAAGGLGIGRWAAYGYIRECYITTCHASDMVQRTYFQFQGENSTPMVQPASEVPGTEVGTKVAFPVKESDLDEALRAVAWLKEVMQLTMGDSFSVDSPDRLPRILPEFSGTVLDLGPFDSGLKGVQLYPMKGNALKYSRVGPQLGSLVVLTNKEQGVGGLPFHVQSPSDNESVFFDGMVVEIPMSFNVPFMPSREEIKYTDEVTALLKRIDAAAAQAVVAKAKELYDEPGLRSKATLSNLLGNDEQWHWFARGTRSKGVLLDPLCAVTGGDPWKGVVKIPFTDEMMSPTLTLKNTSVRDQVLREALVEKGHLGYSMGKAGYVTVTFHPNKPIVLAVNDVKTGGTARFRSWLARQAENVRLVYFSSSVAGEALAAAKSLNAVYGDALDIVLTSSMPEVARAVVGSKVVATRSRSRSSLTFYDRIHTKQSSEVVSFATPGAPVRVWLGKDGGKLSGFKGGVQLTSLVDRWGSGSMLNVLERLKVDRLYLLAPKQEAELLAAQAALKDEGLWDMADDEFGDDEDGQETLRAVQALKSWKTLEEVLSGLVERPFIQDALAGKTVLSVKESWDFNQFLEALAKKPRMELTGTAVDRALRPYLDLLSSEVKVKKQSDANDGLRKLCGGLALIGKSLERDPSDSDHRKELIDTLCRLDGVGHVDYPVQFEELRKQFPLLLSMGRLHTTTEDAVDHLCRAMAAIYR
ncbi:TPA: ATP-binding protein [Burkholderia vietnamiensis]|nr:ATP-binding protein [Burkholderia vietnamiensis]